MADKEHYSVATEVKDGKMSFYFKSIGKDIFTKAIKYFPLRLELEGRTVYNLGFGDYDRENDKIDDTSINNNGDVYKVFNTVLNTVPLFFEENPDCILLVEGSDSNVDNFDVCKLSCTRKCTDTCKKEGRRMALYCRFVNNNYSTLSKDYFFEGGIEEEGDIIAESYEVGKPYDSIFIYKRNKLTL